MKKNTLYTVNRWNKHLFWDGGGVNYNGQNLTPTVQRRSGSYWPLSGTDYATPLVSFNDYNKPAQSMANVQGIDNYVSAPKDNSQT